MAWKKFKITNTHSQVALGNEDDKIEKCMEQACLFSKIFKKADSLHLEDV